MRRQQGWKLWQNYTSHHFIPISILIIILFNYLLSLINEWPSHFSCSLIFHLCNKKWRQTVRSLQWERLRMQVWKLKNIRGNEQEEILTGDPNRTPNFCWKHIKLRPVINQLQSFLIINAILFAIQVWINFKNKFLYLFNCPIFIYSLLIVLFK